MRPGLFCLSLLEYNWRGGGCAFFFLSCFCLGLLFKIYFNVAYFDKELWWWTSFFHDDRWMAPLLLLLDLFEKISVISQRKAEANKLRVSKHFGFVWFSSFTSCWVHEMSFKIAFLYFIWTYYSATLLRWNLFMVKLFQTKWLKCSWCTFSLFSFNTNFCLGKLF